MHTTTNTDIDDLELTAGWQDGRKVWFVSDGTVIPHISGGDGDDELDGLSDDEIEALESLSDEDVEKLEGLSTDELAVLTGTATDWKAEAERWKRQARKHEQRSKANKKELDRVRGGKKPEKQTGGQGENEPDLDAVRDEVRAEMRKDFAEQTIELYMDAQVDAGRLSGDQADVLLDSIDASKFIDDDGDVDTDKVKALIEGIAKPATGSNGSGKGGFPDTGQGRRNGGRKRGEKSSSVAAGRELFTERHGNTKSTKTN